MTNKTCSKLDEAELTETSKNGGYKVCFHLIKRNTETFTYVHSLLNSCNCEFLFECVVSQARKWYIKK